MALLKEYKRYLKEYQEKCGDQTIILMQCGDFFEIYFDDNEDRFYLNISEILDYTIGKKILKNSVIYMIGWPLHSSDKQIQKLQENNFTIVLVEQVTSGSNPIRKVTDTITPGIYMNINSVNSNYIMSLIVTEGHHFRTQLPYVNVGICVVDITTARIFIYENLLEAVYNFVHVYKPKEVLCYNLTENYDKKYILETIDLDDNNIKYYDEIDNEYGKKAYQESFLKKIYPNIGLLNIFEYLGICRYNNLIIGMIVMFNYINKINEKLIKNINKPEIWNNENELVLTNNTLYQLDIIRTHVKNNRIQCLIDVIDLTSTSMGKREFRNKILQPIRDIDILNNTYNLVEYLMRNDNYKEIEDNLKSVKDIERGHRKLSLSKINPIEYAKYNDSYLYIIELLKLFNDDELKDKLNMINDYEIEYLNEEMTNYFAFYRNTFDIDKILTNQKNYIKKGIDEGIDLVQDKFNKLYDEFENIKTTLVDLCKSGNKSGSKNFDIKLEYTQKLGYSLNLTQVRSLMLKSKLEGDNCKGKNPKKDDDNQMIDNTQLIHDTVGINYKFVGKTQNIKKIESPKLEKMSNDMTILLDKIQYLVNEKFTEFIKIFANEKYIVFFKKLNKFVTDIDIYKSYAKVSKKNNYSKPIIEDVYDSVSYLKIKDLRHPIVEKINEDETYVANDIDFSPDTQDGIILFSANGVGKSCLMKSVGIAIIMAQAGMFVACKEIKYYPYQNIFSRIVGSDNLFKGHSSFQLEMIELKQILDNANENSLILGDEICRGTEDVSGTSIVVSSIEFLSRLKSSFIFTTHLHQIPEFITDLKNIKCYHLKILEANGKITYLRKIEEGLGSNLYGLEIASSIIHNDIFIERSHEIRNKILNQPNDILSTKKSRYNSNLYINNCNICKKTFKEARLETHHMAEQQYADDDDFIETFHKNHKGNLLVLCDKCHDNVHNGKLTTNGFNKTTDGIELKKDFQKILTKTGF